MTVRGQDAGAAEASPDVVDLDRRCGVRLAALIEGIRQEQWDDATACAGWSVRDLVTHLVAGNVKYVGIAGGDNFVPGAPDVVLDRDPAGQYRRTADELLRAWRRPGALEREIGLPRAQRGPAAVAAWIHLTETLGHGWDLARATGQEPGFDDDAVTACLDACRRRMPPQRGDDVPFADATPATGRSPIDQLAAYLGRDVSR